MVKGCRCLLLQKLILRCLKISGCFLKAAPISQAFQFSHSPQRALSTNSFCFVFEYHSVSISLFFSLSPFVRQRGCDNNGVTVYFLQILIFSQILHKRISHHFSIPSSVSFILWVYLHLLLSKSPVIINPHSFYGVYSLHSIQIAGFV